MAEVTLREVARSAGCSVATVSRVLAGGRPVGADLARRVKDAADRLGYRPNQVARALRSRSTGTVGLVLPQITNPYFPQLVRAVEHALHAQGRALLLADSDDDPAAEASRVHTLLDRQVDGLIVIPADGERSRATVEAAAARVPLVLLDRDCGPGVADSVAVDNAVGMALVRDHLAASGRERPWFLGAAGPASAAVERRRAFEGRALLGDFSLTWGEQAAERAWEALGPGRRPDALVCANDLIAVGALRRLRRLGVRVPEDVAVTGFDGTTTAELADPALTTVRQPVAALAAEAAHLLGRRIAGDGGPSRTVRLAPELVVRDSSASGPAGSRSVSPHSAKEPHQ